MGITRVTRNYQVTLPKDVRELGNIKEGDRLIVTIEDHDMIKMKKFKEDILKKSFGIWKGIRGTSVDYVRRMRKESEGKLKKLGI